MIRYALDDAFIKARVYQIIKEQNIELVVETGLAQGYSTREFCQMVPFVIGIDIQQEAVDATDKLLKEAKVNNYKLFTGSSPEIIADLVQPVQNPHSNRIYHYGIPSQHTLFFLDAHCNGPVYCNGYWPLPDEIAAIPKGKGVMVFHDFKTPGKDFGFDVYDYDGKIVDFEYSVVKPMLDAWSPTHRVEYMDHIDRNSSYRGVGFIYPS